MKLGKRAPRFDPRTLQFANYITSRLPQAPPNKNWSLKVPKPSWTMMMNDQIGDCTFAAVGHQIQLWTAYTQGSMIIAPDSTILKGYEDVGGYVPGKPETDQGCVELDVLNYWRHTGVDNRKIFAYTALEPKNQDHVKLSTWLFGGAYIGIALPETASDQINAGKAWSVVPNAGSKGQPGSWGGHAVNVVSYDRNGLLVITWARLQMMTWGFWAEYVDEAYGVLSQDWIQTNNLAPSGFDFKTLQSDLNVVTNVKQAA